MKKYFILTMGLLAGLASCTDDVKIDMIPQTDEGISRIYATIADEMADTRTLLVNDKKIFWENNDTINVLPSTDIQSSYAFVYDAVAGYFDVENISTGAIPAGNYYATSPRNIGANHESNLVYFKVQENIKYRENSFSQPMIMMADLTSTSAKHFAFYPSAGAIRVSLSGSINVKSITLKGNNGEQIAGAGAVNITTSKPSLEMKEGSYTFWRGVEPNLETIKVNAGYQQVMTMGSGVQLSASPTSFYFVVPPIVFTKGITVTIEGEGLNHSIVKTTSSAVNVGRGVMKSFTAIDTDAILQAEADVQLDALKAIYNNMGGASWTKKWDTTKPLSDTEAWPGVTADKYGVVTKIDLNNNGLTGEIPSEIGDLCFLQDINMSGNNITGGIPKEVAKITTLTKFNVNGNKMDGEVPKEVYTSDAWAHATRDLTQQSGYALTTKYVSSDYSKDGEWTKMFSHTLGAGIPLVITCEAFGDNMYADFNTQATNAMNYFFSIAPYKDFKEYFDVYKLMAVSPNNEVGLNIAYGTEYSGDSYSILSDKVRNRLEKHAELGNSSSNVLTIVLLHETKAEPNRAVCFFSSDGFAAAIAPVDEDMETVIHHEAGGHGFAFLGDEYYDAGSTATFTNLVSVDVDGNPIDIDDMHSNGIYWNVDYHNTNTTAFWKDFWGDATYNSESIGAYPGGMGKYVEGIYHSTPKSTMLSQKDYDKFNPVSRWAIYRQIIIRAGYAEPTIAQFKDYDDDANIAYIPPTLSVLTRGNYVEKNEHKLGAPPVIEWK